MKNTLLAILGLTMLVGCKSTYNADSATAGDLQEEGAVIVVRPDRYTLLGTRSMRDYLEVVYEEFSTNTAGFPVVKLGIRNKGGQHWWNPRGKDFTLFAQTVFYSQPMTETQSRSAPVYKTNKQAVPMALGETTDLVFTCPSRDATGYQIVLSER